MLKLFKYFKVNKGFLVALFTVIILKILGALYLPTITANIINNGVIKGDINYVLRNGGIISIVL